MKKWEVWYIWCSQLPTPHDKYCITIDPEKHWFFFINSDPPRARKARGFAVAIQNFELTCISHESFVDTTTIEKLIEKDVSAALSEPNRNKGFLSPTLRERICQAAHSHGVLSQDELALMVP